MVIGLVCHCFEVRSRVNYRLNGMPLDIVLWSDGYINRILLKPTAIAAEAAPTRYFKVVCTLLGANLFARGIDFSLTIANEFAPTGWFVFGRSGFSRDCHWINQDAIDIPMRPKDDIKRAPPGTIINPLPHSQSMAN